MKLTSTFLLLILSVFIVAIFAINYNPPTAVRYMAVMSQDANLALLDPPYFAYFDETFKG